MQNWKKGYVFGHIDIFWKGHDTQIKKNACKNAYLGSIFIPEKYVFRVCFESPFTRMISGLKYKWPPGMKGDFTVRRMGGGDIQNVTASMCRDKTILINFILRHG